MSLPELELRLRPISAADVPDIVALSTRQFGENPQLSAALTAELTRWQIAKAPTVVARTVDLAFVGFTSARPIQVATSPRPEGQVAVVEHLAVEPRFGAGDARVQILERVLKTLRMLGYSRAATRITDDDSGWYRDGGWEVLKAGRARTWVEPHIARDDLWFPDQPSGSYSPRLVLEFEPGRPVQAWKSLREERPLLETTYPVAPDPRRSLQNADLALREAIADRPDVIERMPRLLLESMGITR